jgi:hypothetical protein
MVAVKLGREAADHQIPDARARFLSRATPLMPLSTEAR